MLFQEWCSLLNGCLIMFLLGSSYTISAWNISFASLLHLSHFQITGLSSAAFFGMFLSPPPGAIYDTIGVQFSCLLFALLFSCGYLYLSLNLFIYDHDNIMSFLFGQGGRLLALFLIGQAGSVAVCAVLGSNENVGGRKHRGKVVGLLMASFSAGSVLYTMFFELFINVSHYFLFLSINAIFVGVFGAFFLLPSTFAGKEYDTLLLNPTPNVTGISLCQNVTFWSIFFPTLIGNGTSLLVLNNIAFLVAADEKKSAADVNNISVYVILFSFCNMSSRIIIGSLSDTYRWTVPRPHWLTISLLLTIVSVLGFLLLPSGYILLPILLSGIAEGGFFATFPVLIRESFGAVHYGKNFGYMSLANAIGYPLVLQPLSTYFYQKHTTVEETCWGKACFQDIFIFCLLAALLCLGGSVLHNKHSLSLGQVSR